jgi:hypothetical protein
MAASDYSGSDESEPEEVNGDDESESLSETTCNGVQGAESEISMLPAQPGGGDTLGWPARPSLFPHIPPYIRFNTHDAEIPIKVPAGRRLFKWKLSTITPIVVRKTLTNSGFAMVRSEFSRGVPQKYITFLSREIPTVPNTISRFSAFGPVAFTV